MKFEPDYIERLAKILSDNGLTEISMEDGEQAITIRKDLPEVVNVASAIPTAVNSVATPAAISSADSNEVKTETKAESAKGRAITSPMVGTFYSASSPETAPFVEIGSVVEAGDVVCIIEAMKLMNEIKSEQSGKIIQICVKNGDPVEYGQVLMYVE